MSPKESFHLGQALVPATGLYTYVSLLETPLNPNAQREDELEQCLQRSAAIL